MNNLIPIERKNDVTIYGRVTNQSGKLGQFEVHSEWAKHDNTIYGLYADAERRMSALIGVHHGKSKMS